MNNIDKKIIKVTPSCEDLIPNKQIKCPLCEKNFSNAGHIQMHLARHHKFYNNKGSRLEPLPKRKDENDLIKLFFCPMDDCIYNERVVNGGRYFTNMKYIRQHYQKVHIEKLFNCFKCDKSFLTKKKKILHDSICGKKFECATCRINYTSREALLTHTKRKQHQPFEGLIKKKTINVVKTTVPIQKLQQNENSKTQVSNQNYADIQISSIMNENSIKNNNTDETNKNANMCLYLLKIAFEAKDQECQTNFDSAVSSILEASNSESCLNTLNIENEFQKSVHQSSQINVNDKDLKETKIIDNTQNNTTNFSPYYDDNCFEELVNENNLCDIETQTEISLALDQLLQYSNNYTQTCDDFLQELCLTDIQTQTNWSMSGDAINNINNLHFNDEFDLNANSDKFIPEKTI